MKSENFRKRSNAIITFLVFVAVLWGNSPVLYAKTQQESGKINVSGIVTDEKGEPLIGVSVIVKGAQILTGTATDMDGKYQLYGVPADGVLEFTSIGMTSQEVAVNNRNKIDVVMKDDAIMLGEMVVVGYGTMRKSDLTGAVASVKTEVIADIPANSIEGLLQGRAAGVQVINSSQDPGAGSTVRIRGNSSLRGSNSPLIVVDGFPLGDAGDLKQINTDDIVSMEVLKDASASAIYGSRGANGVILVTTRRAREGTTSVTVKQQMTISEFSTKLDLWRDPVLMAMLNNESRVNGGLQPLYIGERNSAGVYYPSIEELQTTWTTNTRWDELVFRKAPVSNNTTIGVSSANEKTSFNLSANYFTDKGMYVDDDYMKGGYNLNVGHKLYDNFTIRASNILYLGDRDSNGGQSYWRNPIYPVYNEDGTYYQTTSYDYDHPIAIREHSYNRTKMLDVISSGAFEWQLLPELKLTSQLNYKFGKSTNDQYWPQRYTQVGTENRGRGVIGNTENQNFVSENFANYTNTFNDRHEIGVMLGHSYEWFQYRDSYLTANGFVNESLGNENMGAGEKANNIISNGYSKSKLLSGMGRLNYALDNKYLATITFRADGSSKFGKNQKWAYFPSGAVSWKAHEEDFVKKWDIFDELKFRLSYGISGNQGISPYQTLSRYGTTQYYNEGQWLTAIGPGYVSGYTGQDGIWMVWSGIPNPDLKWETTSQVDFGIDLALLKGRLRTTIDFYQKETSDLLRERNLPFSSGYDRMWVNDGKIMNKGFEVTLDGIIVDTKDWGLNSTLIFSMNRNKVLDLGSSIESGLLKDARTGMEYEVIGNLREQYRSYTNILAIGQPINVFYGYKFDGIIQDINEGLNSGLLGDDALPGEFKYRNIYDDDSAKGVINEDDKMIIGDPNPDFTASLNIGVRWKNFDASIFLNGIFGNDVLNTKMFGDPHNAAFRWTPDNPTNKYPSLRDGRQTRFSDYWIEDGSFVRIQNASVGYTFDLPKERVFASKIRLYLNASNLYTFTKFDGYDPEVDQMGIYTGGYPRLRKWTIGLDLTF
ncbi:TonB-linked outer membrane protein, SusC/RagA family [Porphyromonadaceae bacterium KH3CP3RA]|nr:TonB-linked outer membrane protein, SusC/RagA family [Porphyromonadaceae bacterium KH3CP3RA]